MRNRTTGCLLCYVHIGFRQQSGKLEFGGESPLTMRYERLVINEHPLGPLTRKRFEIAICSNPYATVVAAARRVPIF